jgi:hypothetical protein
MFGENHMERRKEEKRADSLAITARYRTDDDGGEGVTSDSYCGGGSNEATWEGRLANRF